METRGQEHRPTAELIKGAQSIPDPVERRRAVGGILELRRRYAGTGAEFKAPNGRPSGLVAALGEDLGRQAWYAVRTPSFKGWFGDWERAARIAAFESSDDIPLEGDAYRGKYELTKESICAYLKGTLGKTALRNPAIMEDIRLGGTGIHKLTSWGMSNDVYKKLFAHIPEITGKSTLIAEEMPNRPNSHYNKYSHLAGGIKIDGDPYTVHIILGESGGLWYYSHILLHIEKGSLLDGIRHPNPGHPKNTSFSGIKDTTLLRLLQAADSSKIIDDNGEPKPVFRGDRPGLERFANPQGSFFTDEKPLAQRYSSGGLYSLFLCVKNPLVLDEKSFIQARERINDLLFDVYEKDRSELDRDSTYQALRKNYLAFRNGEGSAVRDFYNDFLPKVSEDTPLEEFKEILLKSVHDANVFGWRQIDYKDIDILNPFIKALGYDGIVRPYDPLGRGGIEYVSFDPRQAFVLDPRQTAGPVTQNVALNNGASASPPSDKGASKVNKEQPMPNTNNKEISRKVQEHILHSFDGYDEMMAELKNSKKHFGDSPNFGAEMVDSGFFLVYNDDIRKFLHGLTGETPEAQSRKYSVDQTWGFYRNLINRETPNVLDEGGRSYVKPDRQNPESSMETAINNEGAIKIPTITGNVTHNSNSTSSANKVIAGVNEDFQKHKKDIPITIEQARKAGYVQGVCECVAAVGGDRALAKRLLSEMKVTKAMAKKYAGPETYRGLEETVFAPRPERKLQRGRHRQ